MQLLYVVWARTGKAVHLWEWLKMWCLCVAGASTESWLCLGEESACRLSVKILALCSCVWLS